MFRVRVLAGVALALVTTCGTARAVPVTQVFDEAVVKINEGTFHASPAPVIKSDSETFAVISPWLSSQTFQYTFKLSNTLSDLTVSETTLTGIFGLASETLTLVSPGHTSTSATFGPHSPLSLTVDDLGPGTYTLDVISRFRRAWPLDGYIGAGPFKVSFDVTNVPSVTHTSAVPEPATWAMFVLGFAAVGLLARRRSGARKSLRLTSA
jgi:hypothetical protein